MLTALPPVAVQRLVSTRAACSWFFVVAFWVHDLPTVRRKVRVVGSQFVVDAVLFGVFGGVLGWI